MTEGELVFRCEKGYVSKDTRVLDHFDAVEEKNIYTLITGIVFLKTEPAYSTPQ